MNIIQKYWRVLPRFDFQRFDSSNKFIAYYKRKTGQWKTGGGELFPSLSHLSILLRRMKPSGSAQPSQWGWTPGVVLPFCSLPWLPPTVKEIPPPQRWDATSFSFLLLFFSNPRPPPFRKTNGTACQRFKSILSVLFFFFLFLLRLLLFIFFWSLHSFHFLYTFPWPRCLLKSFKDMNYSALVGMPLKKV